MIKEFHVTDLLGRPGMVRAELHPDLNIITGRNGAGKTSFLKLLWYFQSGNISTALREVPFSQAFLRTTDYCINVKRVVRNSCRIEWNLIGEEPEIYEDIIDDDGDIVEDVESQIQPLILEYGSSLFLPTFRRIEGGFTLNQSRRIVQRGLFQAFQDGGPSRVSKIEEALTEVSGRLSNGKHRFVAAISTSDIVVFLLREYTNISGESNKVQKIVSDEIISQIRSYRRDSPTQQNSASADRILDEVREKIESMESARDARMAPFNTISNMVRQMFRNTGIIINEEIKFGDVASAVNSNMLSSGEKQMLSFISYNAFYKNSAIYIDEPELSLHVDWQRQLFGTLLQQNTSNQFIIATHSPFIYAKFPDKEIIIDEDRGNNE